MSTEVIHESRLRGPLEVAAAILLGLVAVATTASAFQASVWAQQAGEYTTIAGQLRDESFSDNLTSSLAGDDDGRRVLEAFQLDFEIQQGAPDADQLLQRRETLLQGGTPGLAEDYHAWAASGYDLSLHPIATAGHAVAISAQTYGANRASSVAYTLSDSLGARSLQLTIAAVFFALSLLLVGVAGANDAVRVMFGLTLGGALAFLGGVTWTIFAAIG